MFRTKNDKEAGMQVALQPRKKKMTEVPTDVRTEPKTKRRLGRHVRRAFIFFAIAGVILFVLRVVTVPALRTLAELSAPKALPVAPPSETPLEQIVRNVRQQYLLPEGETPTLAMITSLEELKGQAFFAQANVGDAVLMYLKAKKGILWRPSTEQIIEVGPLSVISPEDQLARDEATSTATSTTTHLAASNVNTKTSTGTSTKTITKPSLKKSDAVNTSTSTSTKTSTSNSVNAKATSTATVATKSTALITPTQTVVSR
jgi:hypothetical protein